MPTACYASISFSNFCVYQVDIKSSGVGDGAREKSWCVEYKNLMPLATVIYSGNVFRFMKSEE